VQTRVFPLYEIENGEKHTINIWPKKHVPVKEYLRLQGRFAHLKDADIAYIQENVDREWDKLVAKARVSGQEIPESALKVS